MPRSLKVYITGLVALCAIALAVDEPCDSCRPADPASGGSRRHADDVLAGIAFWTVMTLLASALPVQMPRGSFINTSIATLVAAMSLGGPTAAGWVALIGTTEVRELSGRVPWYGTLANHAGLVLPAVVGGLVTAPSIGRLTRPRSSDFVAAMALAPRRSSAERRLHVTIPWRCEAGIQSPRIVLLGDLPTFFGNWVALSPLAWLMAVCHVLRVWMVGSSSSHPPVWIMRGALDQIIEMRQMFTQTVASLAQAVDARSDWTSGHSQRVQLISVDIGRVMRRSEKELEALEWGGLLHDIGKIGVPDSVLDKPGFLTREERAIMNAHPVIGANIIAPVTRLAPELPIIRHHHEWYNGSGYPDRLMGDEIPVLARILHVADAFEAMTAARPYRLTPLTGEQAMAELRKFAGIQFDPEIVDAFTKTHWAAGIHDAGRETEPRPPVPLIAQAGGRMAKAAAAGANAAGTGLGPAPANAAGRARPAARRRRTRRARARPTRAPWAPRPPLPDPAS